MWSNKLNAPGSKRPLAHTPPPPRFPKDTIEFQFYIIAVNEMYNIFIQREVGLLLTYVRTQF